MLDWMFGRDRADQQRYRDLEDSFVSDLFGGFVTATGLRVTAADALSVPGIAACVQVLSEDLAKVPFNLYKRNRDATRAIADDHPLHALIKGGPAPWISSYAWRRALVHAALVHGNGYSRAWRDPNGSLTHLTLIQPGRTTPRWADDGEPFFDVSGKNGTERGLTFQDVVHIPYRGSSDGAEHGGVLGISPIQQNRETIALALAAERFAAKFFANGARPSLVLEYDKKLPNDEVARRMRASVERVLAGVDNSYKIAITELGMKLRELSFKPSDSQLTETRKEQAFLCCTMFGVPPHKIGILDRATNNNIEHQGIDYVTGPVSSLAKCVETAVSTACLTPAERETYYPEFNLDGLMRGDIASRYRAYAIARQWGWLNVDEIRGWENMDPLPDEAGKRYLTPLNMDPAESDPGKDEPKASEIIRPDASDLRRFAGSWPERPTTAPIIPFQPRKAA
ncbi:MAG: phage portal protein [Bradyrhizobium sp.]|uniref:phage portal protein n=1 Tax=Bradyrhizobium sp. TaxID=376 RepID=UPI003D0C1340